MAATRRDSEDAPRVVSDLADLQSRVPALIDRVNADPRLALAAAANPLLALEELGITLSPELREEVEDRCRFGTKEIARRRVLRSRVWRRIGRHVDLGSESDVRRVLVHDLGLREASEIDTRLPRRGADASEDPVAVLHDRDPVVALLVEYRRLEARRPALATPDAYRRVREGSAGLPIRRLRFRLAPKARRKKG